jgi:hypothetical protein
MAKLRPALMIAAACGFLLATKTLAMASTSESVSPCDNCGGFNGYVVWSGATGPRGVRRLLRDWEGRRYRAGDSLLISLRASGWRPERAQIEIRSGRVPKIRLLRS